MKSFKMAGLMLLSVFVVGCDSAKNELGSEPDNVQVTPASAQLQQTDDLKALGLEVRQMVKTAAADDPKQCKIVAMGHKPCGGPERYLLYSEKTMSSEELEVFFETLNRYNELSRRLLEKSDVVSDCQIRPKPTAVVRNGFCVPAEKNTM